MVESPDQFVRNRLLLREVNERLAEIMPQGVSGEFLCECARNECMETLELPTRVFQIVLSSQNLFLILPGHESGEIERVVQTSETFTLVETNYNDVVFASRREAPPRRLAQGNPSSD